MKFNFFPRSVSSLISAVLIVRLIMMNPLPACATLLVVSPVFLFFRAAICAQFFPHDRHEKNPPIVYNQRAYFIFSFHARCSCRPINSALKDKIMREPPVSEE